MKRKTSHSIAIATLLVAAAQFAAAQTADRTINSFDTGTQGAQPDGCGFWYGTGTGGWDASQDATGNGGGSLYIQTTWGGGDTPLTEYVCLPGDNLWWQGAGTFNLSDYKSIQFDLKWDTASTVGISEWNDPASFPNGTLSGSVPGLEINAAAGNGGLTLLVTTNIANAASNGWVHVVIPVNPLQSGIDPCVGIMFKKWLNNNATISGGPHTANFWVDNVILEGTAGPPPPPTIKPLAKPSRGLNVFASTQANSFYDRQEIVSRETNGLCWIGSASVANPVTYSFTLTNFPTDPATYGCAAYLFFSPNPGFIPAAPDWNNTNCAVAVLQYGAGGATLQFQYKVDEDNQNAMLSGGHEARGYYTNAPGSWDGVTPNYLETGNLGSVTNATVLGTWSIRFTSDTNVTLIAPDNSSSSLVIPPYNVGKLGPTTNGFNLYLGFQANNLASLNEAAVYSRFKVTGVASAFDEDFLAQTTLDTNRWDNSVSGGPSGVRIIPAGSAYWMNWSLPDGGFAAESTADLANPLSWFDLTGPSVSMVNQRSKLIASSELPAGGSAFFRLTKRAFTQLQVLLPGETNAPNTLTGKIGTPAPVSLGDGGYATVTINAVDSTWHVVTSGSGSIQLTSSDTGAIMPLDAPLVGGTLQQIVQFATPGSWTITATNTTATLPAATSSAVTVVAP
jgi:hypothetical protein